MMIKFFLFQCCSKIATNDLALGEVAAIEAKKFNFAQ